MRKRLLSLLMVLVMIAGLAPSVLATNKDSYSYNPDNAIAYGRKWAKDTNPIYGREDGNNDCANFVSQCLFAGGLQQDDEWYPHSYSWSSAWGLYQYLATLPGTSYKNAEGGLTSKDIIPGMVVWCDGDGPGSATSDVMGHVMLCVGKSGDTPLFVGHSGDVNDDFDWIRYVGPIWGAMTLKTVAGATAPDAPKAVQTFNTVPSNLKISRVDGTTAEISWAGASEATSYEVQIRRENSYGYSETEWRSDSDYHGGTSYRTYDLLSITYGFRVRAVNGSQKSDWLAGTWDNAAGTFTLISAPSAPTVSTSNSPIASKPSATKPRVSASKYTKGADVTVQWDAVQGANSYFINVYIDDNHPVSRNIGNVTSYSLTNVDKGKYVVYIEALNDHGASQASSCSFTVTDQCNHSAGYKTVKQSDGHYAAVCKNCGEEYILSALDTSTAGKYKVTGIIKLSREPYQEAKVNTTLLFGASVDIAGSLKNAYGNLWYKTTDGYWIYKDYLSKQRNQIERDDPNFAKINNYRQGQYSDVPSEQWFTNSVAEAYALGLMKGSGSVFNPYGDVTLAETVTMASRIHSIYTTGADNLVQTGSKWYQVYLDYALENGIIDSGYYNADVGVKVTRAQFAEIFAKALPDKALYPKNSISDNAIPDVSMSVSYAQYVYKLYRAGILTGGDALGTFSPGTFITRAEAATIVSRMAQGNNRKDFSL